MVNDGGGGRREALARAARALQQLPPGHRLKALLDHPQAQAVIQSQPAEDLYFAITEVGLADATEIVQLASPDQFRAFVDLGGWKRDRIEPNAVLTWLRAARGDEPEDFLRKLEALDIELLEAVLREVTVVHDLEDNPDVNPEGLTLETAERRYLIELKGEGLDETAVRQVLLDLMGQDPFKFTRLMEALRWELPSELEETAHRFRSGRLEDLGFPRLEDALRLFTFVKVPEAPSATATALVDPRTNPAWLEVAARALEGNERETWERELRHVVNSALVAEAADPGDAGAVRRVSELARDYLSLGLERLTDGDPSRAGEVVRATPSLRIFQIGFSVTLELKHRADAWVKETPPPLRLLPHEASAVAAMRRKRPLRALRVEGAEPVPFRSRRELQESAALLDRARAQHAVLDRWMDLGDHALAPDALERAFLTRIARVALGLSVAPELSPAALRDLKGGLFQGEAHAPSLSPEAVQRVEVSLQACAATPAERAEASRLTSEGLERLKRELAPAVLSGRDPMPEAGAVLDVGLDGVTPPAGEPL